METIVIDKSSKEYLRIKKRKWREKNPGRDAAIAAVYRKRHPDAVRESESKRVALHGERRNRERRKGEKGFRPNKTWAWNLSKFGISPSDYERMLQAQGGVCAICGNKCISGRRLALDHDHSTGNVRGLLCTRCNPMLGYAKDNIEILRKAIEYLKRFS